jgi:hypothetical protein
MDESGIRALLDRVAHDELPPIRASVERAVRDGRAIRRRRGYLPWAAPLAAAAAVALIAGLVIAVQASMHRPGPATRLRSVPVRFSALEPYASFGWLPAGFLTAGAADKSTLATTELTLQASASGGRTLSLTVVPAKLCRVTGPVTFHGSASKTTFPHLLKCGGFVGPTTLIASAPDVNGGPAYWGTAHQILVWEYGRDAWAELSTTGISGAIVPSSDQPAAVLRDVASHVRFGTAPRVRYGFTISGLPASWRTDPLGGVYNSVVTLGRYQANVSWIVGPANDPTALSIQVAPASLKQKVCPSDTGGSRRVLIDGVSAGITVGRYFNLVQSEDLCALNVHGEQVRILLDLTTQGPGPKPLPGDRQVGDLRTLIKHLRLLGPDVANWTLKPPG